MTNTPTKQIKVPSDAVLDAYVRYCEANGQANQVLAEFKQAVRLEKLSEDVAQTDPVSDTE